MPVLESARRRSSSALAVLASTALVAVGLLAASPAVAAPVEPVVLSEEATFEWGINASSQGASFNGACSFFVAGIADGTESSYTTVDGDVSLIKRGVDGSAIAVTAQNRCAPIDGDDGAQRVVFSKGVATRDADDVVTIQWQGAFTIYSYGGLVPWYVQDPKLTALPDGTGRISATLGGYQSSMADPNVKEPIDPEPDMTILDLQDVDIDGDTIAATPRFTGVDYFALTDRNDPTSPRRTESSIPDSAKQTNPNWGSWPTDIVDFHYRTGLSSYWHTSGLSADPKKGPLPIRLALRGGEPNVVDLSTISISEQPVSYDVVTGEDADFHVTATSSAPLTYQWQISPDGYGWTWNDIEGATSATLRLEDVAQTGVDTGVHPGIRVRISNGAQRIDSGVAQLRSEPAKDLEIISQPVSTTRFVDAPVDLYTYAEGFPTPTYQWQESRDGGATWTDLGEPRTDGNHRIDPITAEQDGAQFRATIANRSGQSLTTDVATTTVLSADVLTLSIIDEPAYAEYPLDPSIDSPTAFFRAGGLPDVLPEKLVLGIVAKDVWDARGADFSQADLPVSTDFEPAWYQVNSTLDAFGIVMEKHALVPSVDYVAVLISGDAGDRSLDTAIPFQLVGQDVPTASVTASATDVTYGDDVVLTAAATGTPVPTLQWQHRTGAGEWSDIGGETSATLTISVTAAAEYRVVATNGLGSAPSNTVQVVDASPSFTPTLLTDVDFTESSTGGISATVVDGMATITVPERDGEWVGVSVHSEPQFLGWSRVADGVVSVALPPGLTGVHHLVVYDVVGAVVGYTAIDLGSVPTPAPPAEPESTPGGGVDTATSGSGSGLAATGAEASPGWSILAIVLLLGGAGALAAGRRRTTRA